MKEAIANRPDDIKRFEKEQLVQLEAPGINIYKRVEIHKDYWPIVPDEHQDNKLYTKPPPEIKEAVKKEKIKRKKFQAEVKEDKKLVKRELKKKLDDLATLV